MVWMLQFYCDILVIPQAMNIEVQMKPNFGPYLPNPVRSQKDVNNVIVPDVKVFKLRISSYKSNQRKIK